MGLKMKRQKFSATGWIFLIAMVFGVGLVLTNIETWAQGPEPSYFRIMQPDETHKIDLAKLIDWFSYGTATIKLNIAESGEVSGRPQLVMDAVRRGPQAFADTLISTMKDWRFTPGASGIAYVTVAVPSRSEMEQQGKVPSISVDLKELQLPEDGNVTIGMARRQVRSLVAQEGFFENIFLTGAPPRVEQAYKKPWYGYLSDVFRNLGMFFQTLFFLVFAALIATLVMAFRTVSRPWEPKTQKKAKQKEAPSAEFDGNGYFSSHDAKLVEYYWVQSIKDTQLDYDLFADYKLSRDSLENLKKNVSNSDSFSQIKELVENHNISDLVGTDFLYKENEGGETRTEKTVPALQKEVACIVDNLVRIRETYHHSGNGGALSQAEGLKMAEEEKIYNRFLWDYLGKPKIKAALTICRKQKSEFPLFEIFESGLQNHQLNRNNWWSSQEIDRSVDRTASVKIEERRGPLDWLWAIGSLSPMFGLFGTVWGISQAFGKIKGVTDTRLLMQKLAGDINVALATTIVGLILGVVAFIFYYWFKSRLDNDATRIEKYFTDITNKA